MSLAAGRAPPAFVAPAWTPSAESPSASIRAIPPAGDAPPGLAVSLAGAPHVSLEQLGLRESSDRAVAIAARTRRDYAQVGDRVRIAFVVQATGGLDLARGLAGVRGLPPDTQAALVTYADRAELALPLGPIAKVAAARPMPAQSIQPALAAAVDLGLRQLADPGARNILIAIGHGDSASEAMPALRRRAQASGIELYAIVEGVGGDDALGLLVRDLVPVASEDELADGVDAVLARITDRVELEFDGASLPWDGRDHAFTVTAADREVEARPRRCPRGPDRRRRAAPAWSASSSCSRASACSRARGGERGSSLRSPGSPPSRPARRRSPSPSSRVHQRPRRCRPARVPRRCCRAPAPVPRCGSRSAMVASR